MKGNTSPPCGTRSIASDLRTIHTETRLYGNIGMNQSLQHREQAHWGCRDLLFASWYEEVSVQEAVPQAVEGLLPAMRG